MKQKLLFLLTALCFGFISGVKADDAYFGSSTKVCGAWDASSKSKNYILQKQGSITVYFTISTNTDTQNYPTWEKWYTWLIDVSCNGWQFAFRADDKPDSNWQGSLTPIISYSDNFAEKYTRDNMDGANVELTLSRDVNNKVTVLATTTKGSNTWWKQEIITLGDGAGDHDLTFYLTGDNCYGEIHSVIGDCVGTTENVTSWWNNFSDYYIIEANKTLTLNFQNFSSKVDNWNNFVTVITNDRNRGETGYAEEVVLRTDDYGWGTHYDHAKFSNNYNWDTYKNDLDGADVELKVRRLGTKTAVKATYTTTSGKKYYQQYVYTSPSGTDPIRVFLTVDQSHITDITSSVAETPGGASEYLYSVKAVDGSDTELKTFATGSYWTGEDDVTIVYPYALSYGGCWYTTEPAGYNVTINASNTDAKVEYAKDESIVYYAEGESLNSSTAAAGMSNGAYGHINAGGSTSNKGFAIGEYGIGTYQGTAYFVSNDVGNNRGFYVRNSALDNAGDANVLGSVRTKNAGLYSTGTFTLTANTALTLSGYTTDGGKVNQSAEFDYVVIRKTAVPATIGANGFATFASEYPLDMTIENMPDGVRAFTASITGNTVSFTKLDQTVPANTGVLLASTDAMKGLTVQIPVVAGGDPVENNRFIAGTGEELPTDDANYYFALNKTKENLTFGKFDQTSVVIATNKAYFKVAKNEFGSGARLVINFDGATGINTVETAEPEANALKDGKFLENGKIVIVKNGVKYGVNGQKLN